MTISVQTRDEWLRALSKPALESPAEVLLRAGDQLIVCAGFEDRALAALTSATQTSRDFSVIIIDYLPRVTENKAVELRQLCARHSVSFEEITYDREAPAGFGVDLARRIAARDGHVVVDVSAMSRLLIVQLIVALGATTRGFTNVDVLYVEAKNYRPSEDEAAAELARSAINPAFAVLFLSSGVFDVTVVPELSSIAPPSNQARLVAYPSLDAHQLTAIRSEIQPSRFEFIEGVPPNTANEWRPRAIAQINQLEAITNCDRFQASTLDYRDSLDILLALYAHYGHRERLIISPTGSKMQTVGVGIFRSFARDVQIVYPTPRTFISPSSYTTGIGSTHRLALAPFAWSRKLTDSGAM